MTSHYQTLDSMRYQTPELESFRQTYRKIQLLNWRKQWLGNRSARIDTNDLTAFVQNLNLSSRVAIDSATEIYACLQSQCRMGYLPVHQAWLVFNYEEVNNALQRPDLFSSNLPQNFDSFLLGVDGPDHTKVRGWLQPLFTPQVMADLSEYIQHELNDRLDKLAKREQFDVVEELTIPFVKSVAGREVPADSLVMLSLLGANREPQTFVQPDEWQLDRPARWNVTFGGGAHHCIGAGVARLQGPLFVRTVLHLMPNLRLATPGPPVYYAPTRLRALASLPVSAS